MNRPIALVTAGGLRIGAAITTALLSAGWRVAVHSRLPGAATVVGDRDEVLRVHGDLADEAGCVGIMDQVVDAWGPPLLLVNNASLFEDDDPSDVGHDRLLRHHAVNVAAPAVLSRLLAERGAEGSCVVNILDQRIANPIADQLSYTLSKLALADLTRILSRSLAPRVRVNAVAPGLTLPTEGYEPGRMERMADLMPLRRNPMPEEIADAVLFLARSTALTGQILFVDGGAHLVGFEKDFDRL